MRQEKMGFWDAVASAGPYSKQYAPRSRQITTPPTTVNFYGLDAFPDAKPTVSKH